MSTQVKAPPLVSMYETIKRIRAFEDKSISLFQDGIVPGFTHAYCGQEAVAVGICGALEPGDRVGSNHRGHGHILARGADTSRMLAEILGKRDGYLQGMGGELHIMDASINIIGANGIVGAGIPVAVGAALSDRLKGNDNVTVSFFGDGATSEGYFHEAVNLAAIWKLPVIFVCENNLYGEFTAASDVVAGEIYKRGEGYGIPGVRVDGQDVVAVYEAASAAVERARAGEGPTLIEAMTYRWYGHFYGEEALTGDYKYRPDEEIADWKANRDPVALTRARILEQGLADEAELDRIDQAIDEEMDRAAEFAQQSPEPPPEQALKFLYSSPIPGPADAAKEH
jgi:acetoin:2,6-dichlorophenolindophenol oxidoreductase subunit alpha